MNCPRCQASQAHLREEYQGREGGKVIWRVYHCERCAFTWRDSEPAATIDNKQREAWFQAHPDQPERYKHNIPPAKEAEQ